MTRFDEFPTELSGLSIHELTDESNACRHDRLFFDPPVEGCSCWNFGWKPRMSKKDEFIAAFQAHAERLGRPPSRKEWDNPPPAGLGSFAARKLFGSWSGAVRAAGYEPNTPQTVPRTRRRRTPMAERFWPKVKKTKSCWLWIGYTNRLGYGSFAVEPDRRDSPHVVAYELVVGPVPDGLELDHLCRNPSCVNPDHLEPVMHAENVRRGRVPKLTLACAQEIRESSESAKALAERFGVDRQQIYEIRKGKTWRPGEMIRLPGKPERRRRAA